MMNTLCPELLSMEGNRLGSWLTLKGTYSYSLIQEAVDETDFVLNDREVHFLWDSELTMYSAAPDLDVGKKESFQGIPSLEVNEGDCQAKKSETETSTTADEARATASWKPFLNLLWRVFRNHEYWAFVGILVLLVTPGYAYLIGPCKEGQFYKSGTCSDCPSGTYMDKPNHQSVSCIPCAKANTLEHTVVKKECTSTSNTVLMCQAGYCDSGHDSFSPICEREHEPCPKHSEQVADFSKISYGWRLEPNWMVITFAAAFVALLLPKWILDVQRAKEHDMIVGNTW